MSKKQKKKPIRNNDGLEDEKQGNRFKVFQEIYENEINELILSIVEERKFDMTTSAYKLYSILVDDYESIQKCTLFTRQENVIHKLSCINSTSIH